MRPDVKLISMLVFYTQIYTTFSQQTVCREQGDIVFIVDSSGSINDADPNNWNRILQFINDIVDQYTIGQNAVRVGVVKFANIGNFVFGLNRYDNKADLMSAISALQFAGGNTNTSGGLLVTRLYAFREENGNRPSVPDTGIVITDGISTRDPNNTVPQARLLKANGVRMIAVGITSQVAADELIGIASRDVNGNPLVIQVETFNNLTAIRDTLVTDTCVVLSTVATPSPTPALQIAGNCREDVDLVFIFDASNNVQEPNFNLMRDFAVSLITDLDIDSGSVRTGLVTYSDTERLIYQLDSFTSRSETLLEVMKIQYTRGASNLASALRFAHNSMFTEQRGDRRLVRDVIILITNSRSRDQQQTLQEARAARAKGIDVIVISIGDWLDVQELNGVATYPYAQNHIRLRRFNELNASLMSRLRETICNNVNECDQSPCQNAITCHDRLGFRWCQCSVGFGGSNCDQQCRQPTDVVFALDSSSSISRQNFELVTDFTHRLIDGLRVGSTDSARPTRVGVLTYANRTNVLFNLNENPDKFRIHQALPPYYSGGGTNTADALRTLTQTMFTSGNGDQPNIPNMAVFITDGRGPDEQATWQQALAARQAGIQIIAIGVGSGVRQEQLEAIAGGPGTDNAITVDNYQQLAGLRGRIINALCNNRDECANQPCRNGGRCIDGINEFHCECPSTHTGRFCERACSGRLDLFFALDNSGSIQHERLPILLDFVRRVVTQLEVGAEKTRVAMVTWSDSARVEFELDQYTRRADVLQALRYVSYMGARTNTAQALRLLRQRLMTSAAGDRPDAPNVVVIVTDGNSNIERVETLREAARLRVAGVHVITVSVGEMVNTAELAAMATEPAERNMLNVRQFGQLTQLVSRIPAAVCDDRNECNSSPCQNGGRCIDRLGRYSCICPAGRVGINCQLACSGQSDIVLVLDLSGSVEEVFEATVRFARQFVYGLDLNPGRDQIALISFGSDVAINFNLNTYQDKLEVLEAITLTRNQGRTNLPHAINTATQLLSRSQSGDRAGVPNVIVLLSDGVATIDVTGTIPAANAAKQARITIYSVAIGNAAQGTTVLQEIAGAQNTPPGEFFFRIADSGQVNAVAQTVSQRLCRQ